MDSMVDDDLNSDDYVLEPVFGTTDQDLSNFIDFNHVTKGSFLVNVNKPVVT